MASVALIGNEIKKVNVFTDNGVQLIINFGEVSNEILSRIYQIKKAGEFKVLLSNIEDWPTALVTEGRIMLDAS